MTLSFLEGARGSPELDIGEVLGLDAEVESERPVVGVLLNDDDGILEEYAGE